MYWWKIGELRSALVEGTLSERARFAYLLIWVIVTAALSQLGVFDFPSNGWDQLNAAVTVAVTVLGTCWIYRVNGGGGGRNFLERYLALGWVYCLRFMAVVLPVMLVAYVVAFIAGLVGETTGLFDVAITSVVSVAYYAGLAKHVRLVVAAAAE